LKERGARSVIDWYDGQPLVNTTGMWIDGSCLEELWSRYVQIAAPRGLAMTVFEGVDGA